MARKHEAEELLRQGRCPSAIAGRMGISTKSVIQYLCTRVGEGALRLSDIYFSWSPEDRAALQRAGKGRFPDDRILLDNRLSRDEFDLFNSLRTRGVFAGDMYEYISKVELALHALARGVLETAFGPDESGWWRKGVPATIRAGCATRREQDDEPVDDVFAYTTLIELPVIILKNWGSFQTALPTYYSSDKRRLDHDLSRLNRIRNAVMHPVKKRKWSEADFEFVRTVAGRLGVHLAHSRRIRLKQPEAE